MGWVVNGPGESRHANIGISLPGTGEAPAAPVFVDGEKTVTLRGEHITESFIELIEQYVYSHYPPHVEESLHADGHQSAPSRILFRGRPAAAEYHRSALEPAELGRAPCRGRARRCMATGGVTGR